MSKRWHNIQCETKRELNKYSEYTWWYLQMKWVSCTDEWNWTKLWNARALFFVAQKGEYLSHMCICALSGFIVVYSDSEIIYFENKREKEKLMFCSLLNKLKCF